MESAAGFKSGMDPGFSIEGAWTRLEGGHGPPTWVLFGENVCEKEIIGSRSGGMHWKILYVDPPMQI